MQNYNNELLDCLNLIKGNGSFVTTHTAPFVFPGLTVQGLGELAYPINHLQANALIKVAQKAPFGKGSETFVDNSVRSAWEIDAEKLQFEGGEWNHFLQKVLGKIKPQLGLEDYQIEANLYKMLVYEKGDFFLPHRDSEKEKGMFGTLIIGLPSLFTGGELVVRFDGEEKRINFSEIASHHEIVYSAFYADCEHEVKPLIEGCRVCLVYNLVQKKMVKEIQLESQRKHVERLASIMNKGKSNQEFSPGIVLLGHQYTPENFSKDQLKLNDRSKAEALIRAADEAGYYAKMCLVTSYLSGIPSYDGYGYDDEPDEYATMEEVYEEELYIETWMESNIPPLGRVRFEEEDLLTTFKLDEDEPIIKESTGYMGNYGPDLMHWYHYGAVYFWPKEEHREVLLNQSMSLQLEWIGFYNTIREQLTSKEVSTCEAILRATLEENNEYQSPDFNVIADWLIGYNDSSCLEEIGRTLLKAHFEKINEISWVKLLKAYDPKIYEQIFDQVIEHGKVSALWHLLSIYNIYSGAAPENKFVAQQMNKLPKYFTKMKEVDASVALVDEKSLNCLLELENKYPQEDNWVISIASLLTANRRRGYINRVIVEVLLASEKLSHLARSLFLVGLEELQKRVNSKPMAPLNWTRALPKHTAYPGQWHELESFLQSPTEQVFDFRRNQHERSEMEMAIKKSKVDLRFETIKKGSPHTLRIYKTQASFENQMKKWEKDVVLLGLIQDSNH